MRVDATHAGETMPTGMLRRGSRYSLRRRVPLDLIAAYGKQEITRALGTSDFAEAKKRLALQWVALDEEFDARRTDLLSKVEAETPELPASGAFAKYREKANSKPTAILKTIADLTASGRLQAQTGNEGRFTRDPASQGARSNVTWDRLVEKWAAERKPTTKTRKDHEAVAEQFRSLVGTLPGTIAKHDVVLFKERLVESGMSVANLKTKISRLKTLINYGHENGLVKERAADGVRIAKSKVKPRVPFDDEALRSLFNGPVHKDGLRPAQGRGEAAFWLPLIALFTGARLEEIAGLRVSDLLEIAYTADDMTDTSAWFFRFRPDSDSNRSLKTQESERNVPVHPDLVRLGLLRYAEAIRLDGQVQLFPDLTAHASGKRAHKWGQWFGLYMRSCGVTDKRIVFHSFRHTLKDAARESSVSEELQRAIMGHSQEGVAGNYGQGFSRRRIVEGMSQIRIIGLPDIEPFC